MCISYFFTFDVSPFTFWLIISYLSMQISEECMHVKVAKLKEDVQMLFKTFNNTFVDTLERLGIGHLFEEHINTAINEIHQSEFNSSGLYEVALCFRLLREHGVWVSPGIYIYIYVIYTYTYVIYVYM